jgi:hypothetical protein
MGCEKLYAVKHIEGVRQPDNEFSSRGTEIHRIMRFYVNHLVETGRKTDYERLDAMCVGQPDDVMEVMEVVKEQCVVEPQKVVGTEMYIGLNNEFVPVTAAKFAKNLIDPVYEGTLDLVLLTSPREAEIRDHKSFWQIIDADTFQSKLYPLLLMCLNPRIQKVTFILDFLRYGAQRSVTYTRDDLPKLKKIAKDARMRQLDLHERASRGGAVRADEGPWGIQDGAGSPKATPGKHCVYCPLLTLGCPLQQTNPYSQMEPSERVAFAVWLAEAKKANDKVLKDFAASEGPQVYRDANGVAFEAGFVKQERRSFPMAETMGYLHGWFEAHPEDSDLKAKLTISGLTTPLKTKKREKLREILDDVKVVNTLTRFKVGRPDDPDEEE